VNPNINVQLFSLREKFEIEIMALACSLQATLYRCHMWHTHLVWGISPYSDIEASEICQLMRQKVVNLATSFLCHAVLPMVSTSSSVATGVS